MQANDNKIILFIIVTTAIIFMLIVIVVTLLYFYQRRQLAYQQNLHSLKLDFEKNLLNTQIEIQEQTFQHISREIHDNINLSLALAKLNLLTLNWNDNEKARAAVNSSASILGSVITDLNSLSQSINTDLIRELGLPKAISNEIAKLKDMAHLQVEFKVKGEPIFMNSEKELVIFRIVQEAFNNVIKHSKASQIWLELNYSSHFLDVVIRDNGIGFNKEEVGLEKEKVHTGLYNMRTRAQIFGGEFLLESKPQKGTQILVTIPYYS